MSDQRTAASGAPLASWRGEFPILETTTYLVSNSLGAMPRGTAASLAQYAQTWAQRGVRAWEEGWWEMPVAVGDMVAGIIGAPTGSVTMHQNITLAEAVVLSCFEPPRPWRYVASAAGLILMVAIIVTTWWVPGFRVTLLCGIPWLLFLTIVWRLSR